jgi:hypothetical protein
MRIPGFSAEMSLDRSAVCYEASGTITLDAKAQIQPQFCVRRGSTITCTECSDGYCWTHTINLPTLY